MENNNTNSVTPKSSKRRKIVLISSAVVFVLFLVLIIFVFTKPKVVRFTNLMGASYIEDITIDKDGHIDAPTNPKLTGWDFVGWCTDQALENIIDINTYNFKSSTTLYAKWRLHRYVINYNANGGNLSLTDSNSPVEYFCEKCNALIIEDELVIKTENNKTTKHCKECNTKIDLENTDPLEGNYVQKFVFVMKHQKPVDHTWKHDFDYTKTPPLFVEYNANMGVNLITPTRKNYEFLGWYDNPEFNGDPITSIDIVNPQDITLYAKWQ